jgi:hypothetical protein
MHTIATADKGDEIARLQPVLLHVILYCLHGVRQIKPMASYCRWVPINLM